MTKNWKIKKLLLIIKSYCLWFNCEKGF